MTATSFGAAPARAAGLPVPPLRLRRIKLQGVGPDGARFDPLDLDFTTRDGAAARVLLSLTNTGGKSTLITLVCSLVVPASRAQIGGKILGDYVLSGDTSHVVCEWEDDTTGRRTVTGTVMEWKDGRRQPAHKMRSTTNMYRAWYLFRTGPGLPGLDDLPYIVDGRRLPYKDFHAAIDDLIDVHPELQGILTDKQQTWTTALEERTSVDPTLFSYQMRMNDSETGAEKLLASFDSPDNVVRFFVAALNDERELETFTGKLEAYSELAAQRAELESLAGFGAEIAPMIDLVAHRATHVEAAQAAAQGARTQGGEHAAALDNRIEQDKESKVELTEAAQAAMRDAGKARYEYGQISDIRQQLLLEEARVRVATTTETAERTEAHAIETAQISQAWQAVDAVIDLNIKREARDAAQIAYDTADAGLGPLRERTAQTAANVAGRLDALVLEAKETTETADAIAAESAEKVQAARDLETAALLSISKVDQELSAIATQVDAAEQARLAAMATGWLNDGERPDACLRRWQETRGTANQKAAQEEERAATAENLFDELAATIATLDQELVELRRAADSAKERLAAFDTDVTVAGADETVLSLIGGAPADGIMLARAAELAGTAATEADARAAQHAAAAHTAQTELNHLDETGTAPTGADVLAVLAILTNARIGSVTGLSWIERNIIDPGKREDFIARNPDLAGGVVISDPKRFADGVECLMTGKPRTKTPVTVTTAPTATTSTESTTQRRYVVVPHRATWDREWAAETRRSLADTVSAEGMAKAQAASAARRYRTAAALCVDFIRRWGQTERTELDSAETEAADTLTQAEDRRTGLVADQKNQRRAATEARAEREQQLSKAKAADKHVNAATAFVSTIADADIAAGRVSGLRSARERAQSDKQAAIDDRRKADAAMKAALRQASDSRSAGESWSRERSSLGVDAAAPDPGGNLEVLRAAWNTIRDELAAAERGLVEAELLNRAEKDVGLARQRTMQYDEATLAEAGRLTESGEASSATTRVGAQQRARQESVDAEKARLRAEADRNSAIAALEAARPAGPDHQNYMDLSNTPWSPAAGTDIPRLLDELEIRNTELRIRRDTAEQAEAEAKELLDAVTADIDSFGDTRGLWVADTVPTNRVFTGSRATARDLMRDYVKAQQKTDAAERTAREELHTTVLGARAAAAAKQWAALEAPAAVRVRSLPEADLVTEAEVLARRIRSMTESASADLRELDEHRSILRDGLLSLCRDQRRLLREVSRSSRLPDGLGDLSHQPAIKIRFDDAPDDEAAGRLATRIDTWAVELTGNPKRAKSAEVRARWLADAVRDTVLDRTRAGAWSIEIMKPRIDGKVVYCPPDRIPHEFSGGQVLTLAVLVYCALSQVRSAHRQGGARPAGTLLLDNPFGAASAEALIEMQHRLAAHTGVQLVCATGLHDPAVDAAFTGTGSVIIKLRNDGDLRRNLSFLRLRALVVDGVDVVESITAGRAAGATQNCVDATRYEIRR